MKALLPLLALALAGCGSRGELKPSANTTPPAIPYGATATPTPQDLLNSSVQARPRRSDELLRSSERRDPDPFDLPPSN